MIPNEFSISFFTSSSGSSARWLSGIPKNFKLFLKSREMKAPINKK